MQTIRITFLTCVLALLGEDVLQHHLPSTDGGNASNSPLNVPLSGTGVVAAPAIGFDPQLPDTFGDVVVGSTSTVTCSDVEARSETVA